MLPDTQRINQATSANLRWVVQLQPAKVLQAIRFAEQRRAFEDKRHQERYEEWQKNKTQRQEPKRSYLPFDAELDGVMSEMCAAEIFGITITDYSIGEIKHFEDMRFPTGELVDIKSTPVLRGKLILHKRQWTNGPDINVLAVRLEPYKWDSYSLSGKAPVVYGIGGWAHHDELMKRADDYMGHFEKPPAKTMRYNELNMDYTRFGVAENMKKYQMCD